MPFAELFRRRHTDHGSNDPSNATEPDEHTRQQEPRLRGVIGYHNAFADGAADYDYDELDRLAARGLRTSTTPAEQDRLPHYECGVTKEGTMAVKYERRSPFEMSPALPWADCYVVLRGTMLCIHNVRSSRFLQDKSAPDSPGRLIKSYTLQHAEAGLAADHKKIELVPRNPVTALLPDTALMHLQQTEPQLFEARNIYVLRLRLEMDQLVFKFRKSEDRQQWLCAICTAMDLAPTIEERSEPKFQTLPRRNRRRREASATNGSGTTQEQPTIRLEAESLVRQQERILREQFPHLASQPLATPLEEPAATPLEEQQNPLASPDPESDDLDNSIFGPASCGNALRSQPREQKWAPSSSHDAAREARCIRRCLPTLLFNSRRANKLIICNGKRMVIDWDAKTMQPWCSLPPLYSPSETIAEEADEDREGSLELLRQPTEQECPRVQQQRPATSSINSHNSINSHDDGGSSGDDCGPQVRRREAWAHRLRKLTTSSSNASVDLRKINSAGRSVSTVELSSSLNLSPPEYRLVPEQYVPPL